MRKTALVFWRTYWDSVTRRTYLLFTFGLPTLLVVLPLLMIGFGYLVVRLLLPAADTRPVGLVDGVGIFTTAPGLQMETVPLQRFTDPRKAAAALEAGELQSYYEVSPDYWQTGVITATAISPPNPLVETRVRAWVEEAVRQRIAPDQFVRYEQGATIIHEGVTSGEASFGTADQGSWLLVVVLIYFARTGSVFTSGYMYDAIAREARERTMEILLTSVTAFQFLAGKLSALLLVGLTQIATWAGLPLLLLWTAERVRGVDYFSRLWGWELLPLLSLSLLGAYVLDQMSAAALGILRVSGGAGPQLFNAASWLMGLTLVYGSYFLPRNPHTAAAVVASLFPLTAPIILPIRAAVSEVPAWQITLGLGGVWASNFAAIFLLRRLLALNLVAYAERFRTGRWLRTWLIRPLGRRLRQARRD